MSGEVAVASVLRSSPATTCIGVLPLKLVASLDDSFAVCVQELSVLGSSLLGTLK